MKKKFTRFFVILAAVICQTGISPLFVHSQSYHRLIRTNTYWDEFHTDVFCYSYIHRIFFTGNDTIIDGISYSILRQFPFESVNPSYLCPPFFIDNVSYPSFYSIREDTIARKVYIYASGFTPHDQLLYDFSLHVGDTLHSDYNGLNTLVLASIDSIVLNNGEVRKKFTFMEIKTLSGTI